MSNQILVPGLSLFQSLGPGPSLDLGLPLGHAPHRSQGLAPHPNLAAPTLGPVGGVFCTCVVVVAQVIEVENTSMLYIFRNPDGMSHCSCSAPSLQCSLVQGCSFCLTPPLPEHPKGPVFPGRALQGMRTAPWWVDGVAVLTDR